jgi:hypothetical protein
MVIMFMHCHAQVRDFKANIQVEKKKHFITDAYYCIKWQIKNIQMLFKRWGFSHSTSSSFKMLENICRSIIYVVIPLTFSIFFFLKVNIDDIDMNLGAGTLFSPYNRLFFLQLEKYPPIVLTFCLENDHNLSKLKFEVFFRQELPGKLIFLLFP